MTEEAVLSVPCLSLALPAWLALMWDILRLSAGTILLWGVVFAVLGMLATVGAFLGLRAVGGYRWGWRHAKWFRLAVLVLMLVILPPLFGVAGALHGAYWVAARILTESDAANDLYAKVGGVGADVIAAAYVLGPQLTAAAGSLDVSTVSLGELSGFRSGRWEISVPELRVRLAGTSGDALESLTARLETEAREQFPVLKQGLGDWVLTTSLDRIVLPAVEEAAGRKAGDSGLPAAGGALLDGFASAARLDGHPDTIGRRDLASHLVRRWIVGPLLLRPLRSAILGRQTIVWGLVGLVVLLPVVFFQAAHAVWWAVSRGAEPVERATGGGDA